MASKEVDEIQGMHDMLLPFLPENLADSTAHGTLFGFEVIHPKFCGHVISAFREGLESTKASTDQVPPLPKLDRLLSSPRLLRPGAHSSLQLLKSRRTLHSIIHSAKHPHSILRKSQKPMAPETSRNRHILNTFGSSGCLPNLLHSLMQDLVIQQRLA